MPVEELAAAECNGVLYAIGGCDIDEIVSNRVWALRPGAATWEEVAPLPTPRKGLAAVECDGLIYAIGGEGSNGKKVATVECFSPVENVWESTAKLKTARSHLAAATHKGLIYAVGGCSIRGSEARFYDVVERFSPKKGVWEFCPRMATEVMAHAAFATDESVVVVGGYAEFGFDDREQIMAAVQSCKPKEKEGAWRLHETLMPTGRCGLAALCVDEWLYVIGGRCEDKEETAEVWCKHVSDLGIRRRRKKPRVWNELSRDEWARVAPMRSARSYHAATVCYRSL
jgi:N-acetylneuraminic acid mutarotase